MLKKLVGPGVQDGQHTDCAAKEAEIMGDVDDRLGRNLHQHCIKPSRFNVVHRMAVQSS
jgi:hypothetical protein